MRNIVFIFILFSSSLSLFSQSDSISANNALTSFELKQKYDGQGSFTIHRTKDTISCLLQSGINRFWRDFDNSDTIKVDDHESYLVFSDINHLLLMDEISRCFNAKWSHFPGDLYFISRNGKIRGESFNQVVMSELHSYDGSFVLEIWYAKEIESGLLFNIAAKVLDSLKSVDCLKEKPIFDGILPIEKAYVKDSLGRKILVELETDEKERLNDIISDSLISLALLSDNYQEIVSVVAGADISLNDLQYLFLEVNSTGLIYDSYYSTEKDYYDLDHNLFSGIVFPVLLLNGKCSPYCVRYADFFNSLVLNKRLDRLKNNDTCSRQICANGNTYFIHSAADQMYYLYSTKSLIASYKNSIYLEGNILDRFNDCYPMQVYFTDINKDGLLDFVYQSGINFSFPVADHRNSYFSDCIYVYFNHNLSDTSRLACLSCDYGWGFYFPQFSTDSSLILSKEGKKLNRKTEDVSLYKFNSGSAVQVLGYKNYQNCDLDLPDIETNSSTYIFYNSSHLGKDGSNEYYLSGMKKERREKRKYRKLIRLYLNHPELINSSGKIINE